VTEEEKNEEQAAGNTEQVEPEAEAPAEALAEEAPAEEAPAEEPEAPAEEAPAEEPEAPAVDEAPAEEPDAPAPAEAPAAEEAPAEESLHPKERRRRRRSQHTGEAKPERSVAERAAERTAERARKAASRRRRRASERARRGEPGQGTPPAEREPGTKKVQLGTVVSDKADKTITVRVDIVRRHRRYEKVVHRSATVHAHDERNEAGEGDVVRVVESRPLSRTKRWRLVEVVEKAR
jgi:small subunit ribosomal protein S17